MESTSKETQSTASKTAERKRFVQNFVIKLTGAEAKKKKPVRGPGRSTIRFRSGEAPGAEVVTSEHVEPKSQKIAGRHGN